MALPEGFDPENSTATPTSSAMGHKEHGRTVAVHSLAVLPEFQRRGLGRLLMRSYIQRIESSQLADRIAILAHEELVPFYEGLGFERKGESKVQFGGGAWIDMVVDLRQGESP